MQISSTNQPITLPTQPQEATYSNKEIYEASQGNAIRGDDAKVTLTPQGQTNLNAKEDAQKEVVAQEEQAQKDAQRGVAVDYLAKSSKQSQAEIYLAVATDGEYESNSNATADVISELRNVQKQNSAVQAYATYQENQAQGKPALF